jgi:N-acetylmuramoyl-L-alanine amidase
VRALIAALLLAPGLAFSAAPPPPAPVHPAVLLDPGHGGSDAGVVAAGLRESDLTLKLAQEVAEALQARGISNQLTRDGDQSLSLSARVVLANSLKPTALLSLHLNNSYSQGAAGPRLFVPGEGPVDDPVAPLWPQAARLRAKDSKALGLSLARALNIGGPRPVQTLKMGLFRGLAVPACVLELGFAGDAAFVATLKDDAQRKALAGKIAGGLARFIRGEGADAP